jgi:hypothetical protein
MSGIAMLAIFALAAGLMYARLLPALLAVPLMALGIAAVAGAGPGGLETTIVEGTTKLAPVIVTVIFGALLSRVTLATGIAETIVTYAAEFGGDRPAVLALALSAAVAVLFTSLTGLGAIIMVGSIVLPIMMTIGVPRKTAATLFMLAFALGFIFNIAQWTFYTKTFGVERAQMQPYAFVLAGIDALALACFAFVRFRATRGSAMWALAADEPLARKRAPLYALPTPVLPIIFYFFLGASPVVAFSLAALYGIATAAPRRAVETFVAAAIRGVEDVAPAIVLFMGIGMLLVATGLPSVKAALAPLVAAIAPRSWLGYVVLFGLLSPLSLYRGPLNPFGVGIAVYTVLAGLGVLPAVTLVAAIMAVVQVQNVVRSDQYAKRLGRKFHGRARRHDNESNASVSGRGRRSRDARRRCVRRRVARHATVSLRFARECGGNGRLLRDRDRGRYQGYRREARGERYHRRGSGQRHLVGGRGARRLRRLRARLARLSRGAARRAAAGCAVCRTQFCGARRRFIERVRRPGTAA